MNLFKCKGIAPQNCITTCYITLSYWRHDAVRDNITFSVKMMSTKSHLKQSYDKQNLSLVAISNEISETHQRLIS